MIPTLMPVARPSWLLKFWLLASGLLYETVVAPADANVHSKIAERRGLHCQRPVRCCCVGRICHLDVVRLVTRHHLIARDAVSDRMHDGPLRSGDAPSSFGLFAGEFTHSGAP